MNWRNRRDLDDLDDSLFDQEEAAERRQERAKAHALAAERMEQEAAREAAVALRVRQFTAQTNTRLILREYELAGVEPRPGLLVSISMLFSMGWRIEEVQGGGNALVGPPRQKKENPNGK